MIFSRIPQLNFANLAPVPVPPAREDGTEPLVRPLRPAEVVTVAKNPKPPHFLPELPADHIFRQNPRAATQYLGRVAHNIFQPKPQHGNRLN